MRFAHVNIVANDWKALSAFYGEVFLCQVVPPIRSQKGKWLEEGTAVPNAELEGVHLRLPGHSDDGPTLEIYQYREILHRKNGQSNFKGLGHLAFEVGDVQKILEKVLEFGGSAHGKLVERTIEGVGNLTFTYCKDPEGNLIELQSWN